jgi:hypothetical protein
MTGFTMPQGAQTASMEQLNQSDSQQAQTIYTQMASDSQKQQMRQWQIQQDEKTKENEIMQDANVNRSKTADKMFLKWDEAIRS